MSAYGTYSFLSASCRLIAHAQGSERHANLIHPADEATGQVDAVHPPQSDAIAGAIEGHDVRIALRTMQESALHS